MALPSSNNPNMISWSGGRSRGRVKVAEVPLRRPGGNASNKYNQFVCNDIVEGINNLAINESIPTEQINEIVHLVRTIKDEETLKSMFDTLYKRALEDKIFGIKLASLFSEVTFFTIEVNENQTMRYLLLSTLQNDYKRKTEIRKESATLFRNVASLLGEIYYQMTLITGKPLRILELPLLDYWSMLLETATDEDIELVATQVIINGKGMYQRPELDQFMLNVRETLANNSLSYAAKGMLLLIIDLANQQFNSLPVNLYDYYTSHLGTTVLIYLQRHNRDLTDAENNEDLKSVKNLKENKNDTNQESEASSTSMLQSKQEAMVKDENCEQRDYAAMNTNKKNFTTENTVPRAIRGPGANNTKKNFKNNSKPFANPMSPKPSSSRNKGWEHDDRFEDAYD
ncbi:uncharacterized protein V1477_005783 [Vespula maculifrons]|uniref:Uncharacterized protein n=1 Tax=Vespula maculifrons TaxID=7453 RepID=A0ABD2CL99_VESMC